MISTLPDLATTKPFSTAELLAISEDINHHYAPVNLVTEAEVVLMPVDPYHVQIYWNLGERLLQQVQTWAGKELALRVYWHADEDSDACDAKLSFDVPVTSMEDQLQVRVPIDQAEYSVALGLLHEPHHFDMITQSNSVAVPRARMMPPQQPAPAKPPAMEAMRPDLDVAVENTVIVENSDISNATAKTSTAQYHDPEKIAALKQTLIEQGYQQHEDAEKHAVEVINSSIVTADNPSGRHFNK